MLIQRKRTRARAAGAAEQNPSAKTAPGPQPTRKLYSIAGLLNERSFDGEFDARGTDYKFTYAPTSAAVTNRKLELVGRLSVRGPRGAAHTVENVRATLIATQGGIGGSPARRQLAASGASPSANISSPSQKQEEAKAPETTQQTPAPEPARPTSLDLKTESTGESGFVGVMYFRLQPLDGTALGVPIDLSRVQFNARLAPTNDIARDLQFIYSDLVDAVYGAKPNEGRATEYVQELNRVLKSTSTASNRSPRAERQEVAASPNQVHMNFHVVEATE